MNPWMLALGGLVLFLAGLGLGYLMARRPADRKAAEELAVVREDFEAYREGVTRHFRDSAGHFQAIGEQYRALYAHMADGAKHFCAGGPGQEAIEFAPRPELEARDAGSGRQPFTAAAAATALAESASPEAPDAEPAGDSERREPTLEPETAGSAEAAGDTAGNPDAGTDESLEETSGRSGPAEDDARESAEAAPVPDPERKESPTAENRTVH